MINYPVGNTGFSTNRYQSPVIGTPTGTYTGAMDYTSGVTGTGTQSPAFDTVHVPGLNGLNPTAPGNGVTTNASTNQILSMLITLIQSLIQSLQGGQSAAMDQGPSPSPGVFAGNSSKKTNSGGGVQAGTGKDTNAGTGTVNNKEVPVPPTNAKANVSDGFINTDTKQQGEGDCVFLSVTRSIGQTEQGRTAIHNAITPNKDGSFEVKFAGSDKSYHVTADEAKKQGQWANGDTDMQILGTAADKYFKEHGQSNGVNGQSFNSISKLITGDNNHSVAYTGRNSVDEIKKALIDAAPDIGKTKSIAISGGVADGGNWKAKDTSHEFAVESIDTKTGTITYTNPWDTSVKRTISIDDMAKQLVADPNGSTIDIYGAK